MQDHALIGEAAKIPISTPKPIISISPILLPSPTRLLDLQIRVSFPTTGHNLPIILFSHGHGRSNHLSSLNGYAPLANFWASHGFVVIQPTHLSSKSLSLDPATPGAPLFWRERVEDMKFILDQLDTIESSAPGLKGRLDQSKVAVAGHSAGGHTASMLLGAQLTDPLSGAAVSLADPRIKAGILLAVPGNGNGGADLSAYAAANYPFLRDTRFAEMQTPALVVWGDADGSPFLTTRGADWHADPYVHGGGEKALLTLFGAGHGLGGIAGWDAKETDDESVERVAVVQRVSWAYLRSRLYGDDEAWHSACVALEGLEAIGMVESK